MSYQVHIRREKRRGCGYRFAGESGVGIYLMGGGIREGCERLPFPTQIPFHRAFRWINPQNEFFPITREPACNCLIPHSHELCPMCNPLKAGTNQGMMWVGDNNYSPDSFSREALLQGISKRMSAMPKDFQIGTHFIYLAHVRAWPVTRTLDGKQVTDHTPGFFYIFRPTHVELVIDDPENIPEKARRLKDQLGDQAIIVKVLPEE